MAVLDDIKTLLNISDTSKDTVLKLYIRRAETAVIKYLNIENETEITNIESTYPDAICQYCIEAINRNGLEGMRQYMQGSRQGMLETGLSDMVKSLLPLPYVKMMG